MANTDKLVELINKLKIEAGDEPLVINFADGNHISGNTQATMANPAVLEALKKANVKDLVLEFVPSKGLQELYTEIKSKISDNKNYSSDNFYKDKNIDHKKVSALELSFVNLLINSAKQGMELSFPDNAGELSKDAIDVIRFLQEPPSIITKGKQECIEPVQSKLAERIPNKYLNIASEEMHLKRLKENSPSDEPVIESVNEKTIEGKNIAVVYGAAHFTKENDLNDGQQAKHKQVVLVATDNDLAVFSSHYEQAKQLPQYRYNPETGDVSEFNIGQVHAAKLAKAMDSTPITRDDSLIAPAIDTPKKLTDEQCRELIPKDLKFKDYSPTDVFFINLFDMITPSFLRSGNGVDSQSSKNSSPSH